MNRQKLDALMSEVSDLLVGAGYVCVDAEWQAHDKILRLYIDVESEGKSMDLDACVKVSQILEEDGRLDRQISTAYTLEVSSPGIERPLRRLKDFQRFIGSDVEVRLSEKVGERRKGRGRLRSVDDSGAEIKITVDTPEGVWTFPLDRLAQANLVHNWGEG